MRAADVQLVVPRGLIAMYPSAVQPHLVTFDAFLAELQQITL